MKLIIPTIFAKTKKQFDEKFSKLVPIANNIQIDFMDGKFVKAKSVQLKDIPNLKKYNNTFEAHLMVLNPEKWIPKINQKGFRKVIFHLEATKNPEELTQKIRKLKLKPMIAINPETPIEKIPKKVPILFMGVHPGKEHQSLIPSTYKRVRLFRERNKRTAIQIDGGVSPRTIQKLARAGANAFNSGSFISKSDNPREAFNKLKTLLTKCCS